MCPELLTLISLLCAVKIGRVLQGVFRRAVYRLFGYTIESNDKWWSLMLRQSLHNYLLWRISGRTCARRKISCITSWCEIARWCKINDAANSDTSILYTSTDIANYIVKLVCAFTHSWISFMRRWLFLSSDTWNSKKSLTLCNMLTHKWPSSLSSKIFNLILSTVNQKEKKNTDNFTFTLSRINKENNNN